MIPRRLLSLALLVFPLGACGGSTNDATGQTAATGGAGGGVTGAGGGVVAQGGAAGGTVTETGGSSGVAGSGASIAGGAAGMGGASSAGASSVGGASGASGSTGCPVEDATCCDVSTGQQTGWTCTPQGPICPAGYDWKFPPDCVAAGNGGSSSAGAAGASGSAGSGGSGQGGCTPTSPCDAGSFCYYPDAKCGTGAPGVCETIPMPCDPPIVGSFCTCSGAVETDLCAMSNEGGAISQLGNCTAPPDTFVCGDHFCAIGQQYCQVGLSDVSGYANSYVCLPVPQPCFSMNALPTCDQCFHSDPCGASCSEDAMMNFTLTCPGG